MLETKSTTARLATLAQLRETVLPNFLDPVPSEDALRDLFDRENIPRFKTNPAAKRGGGPCYYSVAAVEKLFRSRMITRPAGHFRGPVMA